MDDETMPPLTNSPTINLPPEPSTVNYEAQDEKIKSEYQVLWSNTMDEGKYKSSSTYTSVNVLFLCWAENSDDLEVRGEVSRLRDTFEKRFNYNTQTSYLDRSMRQNVQVQVNTIVATFIGAHDDPTTLFIVYYAGHGRPGSYYGSLELHGQTSENDRRELDLLVWNKTEKLLLDAGGDVLEIFDCCYAGNLCLTRGGHRLFEYLAATKEMATTQVPGNDSFTSALIYALEDLVEKKGRFTTVELLRKIKTHASFPENQSPVLSDRKDDVEAGRIMLHPLDKVQEDGSRTVLSSEKDTNLDAFKRHTVTLHFEFANQPSHLDVEMLGRQLNQIFERYTLNVNRVRWGGMRQSAAARAIGSFQQAGRRRRASSEQRQGALDDMGSDSRSGGDNSALLTPSTSPSNRDSPRLMEDTATGNMAVQPLSIGLNTSSRSLGFSEEG